MRGLIYHSCETEGDAQQGEQLDLRIIARAPHWFVSVGVLVRNLCILLVGIWVFLCVRIFFLHHGSPFGGEAGCVWTIRVSEEACARDHANEPHLCRISFTAALLASMSARKTQHVSAYSKSGTNPQGPGCKSLERDTGLS
jgi:hypothetical protein